MKSLEKKYQLKVSLEKVFKALIDPIEIEQWSGSGAVMEPHPKGEFSLWGGSIIGINQVVEKNRIQQLWKESNWADYSNVTFEIQAQDDQNTILKLIHTNIPENSFKDIQRGWDDYYLGPLKSYLEQ